MRLDDTTPYMFSILYVCCLPVSLTWRFGPSLRRPPRAFRIRQSTCSPSLSPFSIYQCVDKRLHIAYHAAEDYPSFYSSPRHRLDEPKLRPRSQRCAAAALAACTFCAYKYAFTPLVCTRTLFSSFHSSSRLMECPNFLYNLPFSSSMPLLSSAFSASSSSISFLTSADADSSMLSASSFSTITKVSPTP